MIKTSMASRADTQLAVFANSRNAMIIFDNSGRCLLSNDATSHLSGLSRDKIMGKYLSDLLPPELNKQLQTDLTIMMQKGSVAGEAYFSNSEQKTICFRYNASANIVAGCHLAILVRNPSSQQYDKSLDRRVNIDKLSPRERQILQLLALGHRGVDISDKLCISPETVRVHIRNALRKLQARTRSHAIAIAIRDDIIDLPEEKN